MGRSPNRVVATALGAASLALGITGFFVSSQVGFVDTAGTLLLGFFGVNPLLNIVHAVIGAALLFAGISGVRAAKTVDSIVGTLCLVLGMVGLFVAGSLYNFVALNGADNVLHFGTSALLLAVGLGADRPVKTAKA
jgi:hypothetical protein